MRKNIVSEFYFLILLSAIIGMHGTLKSTQAIINGIKDLKQPAKVNAFFDALQKEENEYREETPGPLKDKRAYDLAVDIISADLLFKNLSDSELGLDLLAKLTPIHSTLSNDINFKRNYELAKEKVSDPLEKNKNVETLMKAAKNDAGLFHWYKAWNTYAKMKAPTSSSTTETKTTVNPLFGKKIPQPAADKAATEKAEADRIAAEKAAVIDKARTDRIAADKSVAEQQLKKLKDWLKQVEDAENTSGKSAQIKGQLNTLIGNLEKPEARKIVKSKMDQAQRDVARFLVEAKKSPSTNSRTATADKIAADKKAATERAAQEAARIAAEKAKAEASINPVGAAKALEALAESLAELARR